MSSTVLISHNDLDGIACIVLAIHFRLPIDEMYITSYNSDNSEIYNKFQRIIITDFSITENDFKALRKKGKQIVILDHHKSSEWISKYSNCISDLKRCGSRIFYESFIRRSSPACTQFIKLVDIYDRWITSDPLWEQALDLNFLYEQRCRPINRTTLIFKNHSYEKTFYKSFISSTLSKFHSTFSFTETDIKYITQAKEHLESEYQKAKSTLSFHTDTRNIKYAIIQHTDFTSLICHRVLQENPDITYVLALSTVTINARSRDNFDVTQLNGINGHKNAGGGRYSASYIKQLLLNQAVMTYK